MAVDTSNLTRSVTAAGPSRFCTGFPVRRAIQADLPDHQRNTARDYATGRGVRQAAPRGLEEASGGSRFFLCVCGKLKVLYNCTFGRIVAIFGWNYGPVGSVGGFSCGVGNSGIGCECRTTARAAGATQNSAAHFTIASGRAACDQAIDRLVAAGRRPGTRRSCCRCRGAARNRFPTAGFAGEFTRPGKSHRAGQARTAPRTAPRAEPAIAACCRARSSAIARAGLRLCRT